jgi:hypothetical protein
MKIPIVQILECAVEIYQLATPPVNQLLCVGMLRAHLAYIMHSH